MPAPTWIDTTVPYAQQEGEDVYHYLVANGAAVLQVDVDKLAVNLVVTADRDVTALMAAFVAPAPPPMIDLVALLAALTGTDPTAKAAARTTLLAAQAAGVVAHVGGRGRGQ